MTEIRIHGRGGQGGVTLAKLVATSRFLLGDSVQAFGLYAAERSGAPIQAFCRYDNDTIRNRNIIYEPDHVIVLDPTLVSPAITSGLKPGGWILINTPDPPATFAERFSGYRLATIDATSIALRNKLGTRSVPIVNTALAGAAARLLDMDLASVGAALEHLGLVGGNLSAAEQAYQEVRTLGEVSEEIHPEKPVLPTNFVPGILKEPARAFPAIKTGQWATQQPDRTEYIPPCNHVCPAGNDVQGFLHALANGREDEALGILLQTTPFPSICGRVCPAPCMEQCNRAELDGAVNVRDLERYAGDHGKHRVERLEERQERIAIIGSGPAGLSAAYHLGKLGYKVRLLEAGPELGGLLRTGIPPYRLPRDVVDREIRRILDLGVEPSTGWRVDRESLLKLAREHDAVLVATGLQEMRALRLGSENDAVEQGIDFLDRANVGEVRLQKEEVIVVGGGNTAFDAARTALRIGAKSVRVIYRRTREEMPAIAEEIDQGIEEGLQVDYLTAPVKLSPHNGRHLLTCRRMELGAPDESGRRRPVEVAGSDFELECDRVILALGQSPELSIFPEGTEVREGERLIGLLETPVFAVGDLANNDGTVSAAIGSGRRAALHIHHTFTGEQLLAAPHDPDRVIGPESIKMHLFERQGRDEGLTQDPAKRRYTFDEVHEGLASPEEARRCLSCGVCNECDRCVTYCPDGVLKRVGHEFVFDYTYCKGCGICAAECPRNVIYMGQIH